MITLDQVKKAIARVEADGWKIAVGEWINESNKECCPLVALAIAQTGKIPTYTELEMGEHIARQLGLSSHDAYRFSDGFDGGKPPPAYQAPEDEMHKLGRTVREFTNARN